MRHLNLNLRFLNFGESLFIVCNMLTTPLHSRGLYECKTLEVYEPYTQSTDYLEKVPMMKYYFMLLSFLVF